MLIKNNNFQNSSEAFKTYTDFIILKSYNKEFKVHYSFCKLVNYLEKIIVNSTLHQDELDYFKTIKYQWRKESFLLGRYTSKKLISDLTGENNLKNIIIKNGIFNQPTLIYKKLNNMNISISHCNNFGLAVAYNDQIFIGVDIEKVDINKNEVYEKASTDYEKNLFLDERVSYNLVLSIIWASKESLSKALKLGFTSSLKVFEVKSIIEKEGYYISTYVNFPQYNTISIFIEDYIFSIAFPKELQLIFDIENITKKLQNMILDN
ncbi:MAG: 4'-phosphopantetheinyl transferase superfamily protein [Clostridiaceae bacterium]